MREWLAVSHELPELTSLALALFEDRACIPRSKVRSSCRKQARAISSFVACVLAESKAKLADPANQNEAMNAKYQEITSLAQEILVLVEILFADYEVPCISTRGSLANDQPSLLSN